MNRGSFINQSIVVIFHMIKNAARLSFETTIEPAVTVKTYSIVTANSVRIYCPQNIWDYV